jgi:hypothetical protein
MVIDREALEGIFGILSGGLQIYGLFCKILAHFILVRTYFVYNHTSSSRFAIRTGAAGKSCEG